MRKFAWLDLETTGLDEGTCQIIEVACIITDDNCNVLGEYEALINPGPDAFYEPGAAGMHKKSGLIEKVASGSNLKQIELELLSFMRSYETRKKRLYLAGNSVHFDARFMKKYMPSIIDHVCHRYLDVSALGLAFHAWFGDEADFIADRPHRAKADLHRSMSELMFYKENFVKTA